MSPSRRRASQVLGGLLVLALAVLGFILARGVSQSGSEQTSEELPVAIESPVPSATPQSADGALAALPTVDLTLAAIVRPSPLQEWASAVLDKTIEHFNGGSLLAPADFSRLQGNELRGPLTQLDGSLAIGEETVIPDVPATIEIVLPDSSQPGNLLNLGRIEHDANTLTLRIAGQQEGSQSVRSLSGDLLPGDALVALAQEAQTRGLTLVVVYWGTPGEGGILALIEMVPVTTEIPVTQVPPEETPTPGAPPLPTATPSPTLVYQQAIRLTIEDNLDALIEVAQRNPELAREALGSYTQSHTLVGVLTWDTDQGQPNIAGRPVMLDAALAQSLTLFGLENEPGPVPMTTTFLEARWDGDGTLVINENASQWYYGYRLSEIVHWLVLAAEDQGGQLTVAYDDVGSYRALTVIDFQPLPLPPGT
jgi:hypothetical protein